MEGANSIGCGGGSHGDEVVVAANDAGCSGGRAKVLEETVGDDYEPTQQEVEQYAEWLGIDADEDADLLWIAHQGLKTPLPKPWKPYQSSDGEIFYFNPETGLNTWDHPCDESLRALYAAELAKKRAKLARGAANSSSDTAESASVQRAVRACAPAAPAPALLRPGSGSSSQKKDFAAPPAAGAAGRATGATAAPRWVAACRGFLETWWWGCRGGTGGRGRGRSTAGSSSGNASSGRARRLLRDAARARGGLRCQSGARDPRGVCSCG